MLCQIFIPDGQTAASVGKGYDLATAEERDVARERATVQVGAPRQQDAPQQEEDQLPEWWNPTPALHVSLYYKEEVWSSDFCYRALNPARQCIAAASVALFRCDPCTMRCWHFSGLKPPLTPLMHQ